MAEISKPTFLSKIWARIGGKRTPDDAKIDQGWVVEIPTYQDFNFLFNKHSEAIAHINQHGIAVWDATTEYQAGKSVVMGSDGNFYFSKITSTNINPVTDTSFTTWELTHVGTRRNRPRLTLTLQNGWIAGALTTQAEIVDGVLYFTGAPTSGTITAFTTISTLPVSYRPSGTRYFSVFLDDTGSSGWVLIPMRILSTGEVQNLIALPNNTGLILSGSVLL